jgi:hypothetical protein
VQHHPALWAKGGGYIIKEECGAIWIAGCGEILQFSAYNQYSTVEETANISNTRETKHKHPYSDASRTILLLVCF